MRQRTLGVFVILLGLVLILLSGASLLYHQLDHSNPKGFSSLYINPESNNQMVIFTIENKYSIDREYTYEILVDDSKIVTDRVLVPAKSEQIVSYAIPTQNTEDQFTKNRIDVVLPSEQLEVYYFP